MKSAALDELIVERWSDAVDFVAAVDDFEQRAMKMFEEEAGRQVREWLADKGYELKVNGKDAEYRAYRRDWLDEEQEPKALLVMGALFPSGFLSVDSLHPFLWVYLKGDNEIRGRRAEQLQASASSEWLNDETKKNRQPLGQYLRDVQPADLRNFMHDPSALAQFVIQRMPALLELEGAVTRALTLT